jgi:protein gp37
MQANPNPKVYLPYLGTAADGEWTGRVNMVEDRLDQPMRWRDGRKIFVNAQSDLFHKGVTDEFIAKVWAVMALTPRHTFQILTKRPARMRSLLSSGRFADLVVAAFSTVIDQTAARMPPHDFDAAYAHITDRVHMDEPLPPLPNVHLGVSVEDQKRADLRIPQLLATPAAVRWLSCEPLLGPVFLPQWGDHTWLPDSRHNPDWNLPLVDWVVVGGESGPGARPMHPEWARSLRDQCAAAGVPFLFKQWGEWLPTHEGRHRLTYDGTLSEPHGGCVMSGEELIARVGKKAAGRVLDGVTHDGYPEEARH